MSSSGLHSSLEPVEDVASLARPMAERKGLELRTDVPRDHVRVAMDAGKVRQILLHLLAHAVKSTEEGRVELEVRVEESRLVLIVSDTGIGIPEANQEEVFEPFNQIAPSETRVAGGVGIGLNVVENLVRLLDGSIELESTPRRGTTFAVGLPLQTPSRGERE